MEKITAIKAKEWLEETPHPRITPFGWPGPVLRRTAELAPMAPTVHRALLHRAEMAAAVPGDMWWLVDAPALAVPSGIATKRVLALTGSELEWCRWGCELGSYGKFPLAAVLYYQGQLVGGPSTQVDGMEEAGFSALIRLKIRNPASTRLLVVHASRAGVRFGDHLDGEMVQLLHNVEAGTDRLRDWDELHHGSMIDATDEACKSLRDLARHLQGVLRT